MFENCADEKVGSKTDRWLPGLDPAGLPRDPVAPVGLVLPPSSPRGPTAQRADAGDCQDQDSVRLQSDLHLA